jgi:hypothetical protein
MYQSFPQKAYPEQSSAMPIMPAPANFAPRPREDCEIAPVHKNNGLLNNLKIFDDLNIDDIILIGIIILLLTEGTGTEEWILIGLLAFILLQ